MSIAMVRVPYSQLVRLIEQILQRHGVAADRANLCARLLADADRDGVPSHGVNQFQGLLAGIADGRVRPDAPLTRVAAFGSLERWDGNLGLGQWNAWQSMNRAIELTKEHGIGCVALARTNHWMRAGNYGWEAADAGRIGICFTNTSALMAAWGGRERKLGNNPLVIAVPRGTEAGAPHVVLDIALSQFSIGRLQLFRKAGELAPHPAGFDASGQETSDPEAILSGGSALPIGYWKGAGLAIVLDLISAVLSGGLLTADITRQERETSVSQVFIAIDPTSLGSEVHQAAERLIDDLHRSDAIDPSCSIRYPGERAWQTRQESINHGVPVHAEVWSALQAL